MLNPLFNTNYLQVHRNVKCKNIKVIYRLFSRMWCQEPIRANKHKSLNKRWFDIDPPSTTLNQHQINIGSTSCVCWVNAFRLCIVMVHRHGSFSKSVLQHTKYNNSKVTLHILRIDKILRLMLRVLIDAGILSQSLLSYRPFLFKMSRSL